MTDPQPPREADLGYAEDVEAELVRQAHEQFQRDPAAFDLFGGLAPYLQRLHQAVDEAAEYQRRQGERLAAAQQHREPPDLGGTDYLSVEHPQLKQWVTDNFDSGSVHDVGRTWNRIGEALTELETALRSAAGREFTEHWRGDAARRAHEYTTELAGFAGHTGDGFKLMANRISVQGDAADTARNMPDPVEFDLRTELLRALVTPDPFTGMAQFEARFAEKREKHAEAARYMAAMEGQFAESAAIMPVFGSVPQFADAGNGPAAALSGRVDQPGTGVGGTAVHQAAPMGSFGSAVPARELLPASAWPVSGAPVGAGAETGQPGGGVGTGRIGTGSAGRGGVPAGRDAERFTAGRSTAGRSGAGWSRPGQAGSGQSGQGRSGAGWPGSGQSGQGQSGSGRSGPGQPGAGQSGTGHGPRGVGGAVPERDGMAQRGTDGRPREVGPHGGAGRGLVGGGPGAPMLGTGRREDDEVRRRPSWLVETDDLWGSSGPVAPPVIGERPAG